jgi:uncharacterized membrane protein YhhN
MDSIGQLFAIDYFPYLLTAFIVIFSFRELVSFKKIISLQYLLTPLVTVTIILIALLSCSYHNRMTGYSFFVLTALILSLIGDVILMNEDSNLFTHGLLFFLMGHVSYIFAFSIGYEFRYWNGAVAVILLLLNLALFYKIKVKSAFIYGLVLSTMVCLAFSGLNWGYSLKALLLVLGAVLFFFSDAILAVDRFYRSIPHSTVITWLLYALAQLCFALTTYYA